MRFVFFLLMALSLPLTATATDRNELIHDIVEREILPGFDLLDRKAGELAADARMSCAETDLRQSFEDAFAAWTRVSHLRFGPSEEDNRAFALTFWPDPRGKTPKALRQLLLNAETAAWKPGSFRDQSIAVRGFHALEYLLYDPEMTKLGSAEELCALIRAVADDIHVTTADLRAAWHDYAPVLTTTGPEKSYRSDKEVLQVLFKSASTGLQFTADMRFGRPLGTFDRPRPNRAEAWRSGQSLDLITAAVRGSGFLALRLASQDEELSADMDTALSRFLDGATQLDDPALAGVATPQGRIRVEALLTGLNRLRRIVDHKLGPHLDVTGGFNALDGD